MPEALDAEAEAEFDLLAVEGSFWTGTRLFIGVVTFVWAAVAFAYFYLRESDTRALWRPHGVTPPTLLGTLVAMAVVAGAVAAVYGRYTLRDGRQLDWGFSAWLTVGLGLVAAGLQVWELTRLSFLPGLSGYTSAFIGFAPLNAAFILGGAYWMETTVARAMRLRSRLADSGGVPASPLPDARLLRANIDGATYFWIYMALVDALFWVLFYVL
ncbi:MAG: hypothetical protein ACYDEN_00825 [Acidimicrobiales bacterium]